MENRQKSDDFKLVNLDQLQRFLGDLIVDIKDSMERGYKMYIRKISDFSGLVFHTRLSTLDHDILPLDGIAKRYAHRLELVLPELNKHSDSCFEVKAQQYYYGYIANIVILKDDAPWVAIEFNSYLDYDAGILKPALHRRGEILNKAAAFKAVIQYLLMAYR